MNARVRWLLQVLASGLSGRPSPPKPRFKNISQADIRQATKIFGDRLRKELAVVGSKHGLEIEMQLSEIIDEAQRQLLTRNGMDPDRDLGR